MKKTTILCAALTLLLAAPAATLSAAPQEPAPAGQPAEAIKLDQKKQKDLARLRDTEDSRAQKARARAEKDYQAEIDKSTKAAADQKAKTLQQIDDKKRDNMRKGEAKIDKEYQGKHEKLTKGKPVE